MTQATLRRGATDALFWSLIYTALWALFAAGQGWLIDLDRSRRRLPETGWRSRNLARLQRSLLKLRGERPVEQVRADFARLRAAYDARWAKGY